MTDEDKKLAEAHKKAMEAIRAFNKEADETLKVGRKMIGL